MPKVKVKAESKSELVAFRISPRNRYGIELICRAHGQTLTAAMAFAIRKLLENPEHGLPTEQGYVALEEIQARTYSPNPAQRFLNLAQEYPSLLGEQEQEAWKAILKRPGKFRNADEKWNLDAVLEMLEEHGT